MTYTVLVFEDKDDGGFWAKVADLPGCYTSGESLEEIEENVKDAIATYLGAIREAGEPEPEPAVHKLEVAVTYPGYAGQQEQRRTNPPPPVVPGEAEGEGRI